MRWSSIKLATLLALAAGTFAEAAPIYTTTDLGTSYQLRADAGGQVYGVANSDGSVVYAFDKSPVTEIYERTNTPQGRPYTYYVFTMQNGPHKVGYVYDYGNGPDGFHPTFEGYTNGWFTPTSQSPVSDINSHGQVVGMSLFYQAPGSYAAFSDPNGQSHNFNAGAAVVDNLNTYIQAIPGVTLTSAVKIDDLGRIVAFGSNGDVYLLTPAALGPAATVPEPSTALMLGVAGTLLGLHSVRRKSRRWETLLS
jgi:hypothetical protein